MFIPILTFLIIFGGGLLLTKVAYKSRSSGQSGITPKDADMFDYVRWGSNNGIHLLQQGVLELKGNTIILLDKAGSPVFEAEVSQATISFVQTKWGIDIACNGESYNARIDYGTLGGFFKVGDRYKQWAAAIASRGGPNFMSDRDMVSRAAFSPLSPIYIIPIAVIVGIAFYLATT